MLTCAYASGAFTNILMWRVDSMQSSQTVFSFLHTVSELEIILGRDFSYLQGTNNVLEAFSTVYLLVLFLILPLVRTLDEIIGGPSPVALLNLLNEAVLDTHVRNWIIDIRRRRQLTNILWQ